MRCSVLVVVLALVLGASAHAVLRYPVPFNTNPTTQGPCGVSAITDGMASTPMVTWTANKLATITWNLVASDGGGNLVGAFDPLGGTKFTVDAWTAPFPTAGSGVFYNKTFTVPADLDCDKSPTKLCTFRVASNNWNSCTMVKICTATNCVAPPPPPKQCKAIVKPLNFCPAQSGAAISEGYSPNDIDAELNATFSLNLGNPNVFATPNGPNCRTLYKDFLCASSLPPCNPSTGAIDKSAQACKQKCQKTMKACSLTTIHANLYDCNTLPNCAGQSGGANSGGGMSPGGKAALSLFFIGIFGAVIVAGVWYHKKGNIFGYAFDKDLKKVVKVPANPHNYTAYVDREYKM